MTVGPGPSARIPWAGWPSGPAWPILLPDYRRRIRKSRTKVAPRTGTDNVVAHQIEFPRPITKRVTAVPSPAGCARNATLILLGLQGRSLDHRPTPDRHRAAVADGGPTAIRWRDTSSPVLWNKAGQIGWHKPLMRRQKQAELLVRQLDPRPLSLSKPRWLSSCRQSGGALANTASSEYFSRKSRRNPPFADC